MVDKLLLAGPLRYCLDHVRRNTVRDPGKKIEMFALETVTPTQGKMEARKELRMHRADEERIRAAANATGLQEADFIRQAALLRAQEVERRMSLSVLPIEAFEVFGAAVHTPGKKVLGLVRAAEATTGLLKDAG